MSKPVAPAAPPDLLERQLALDAAKSVLVQAPAGSGKTDLLTRRFLRLLAEVDDPGQIVAITFTIAAAAEMRQRILAELEKASQRSPDSLDDDEFSLAMLARRALSRSEARGWKLLDLPGQLRISTIDSFCRELALQQPLLSGFGGGLDVAAQPAELYRRAARHTLNEIDNPASPINAAAEALLVWHDNNWRGLETLLVDMLSKRDRWMHDFVVGPEPDWEVLRTRLERPFANAVRESLTEVSLLLDQVPGATDEALLLSRFACSNPGGEVHRTLAELAAFPRAPFISADDLEDAHQALLCLTHLVLTNDCAFRRTVNKSHGFPADRKPEKARIMDLICRLDAIPGLEAALAAVRDLPPARYTDEDWRIVRACFILLRHAAAQLKVEFAESASVDFIEVAQIAQSILRAEDDSPTDAALAIADGIRHLLVDEFQDTSRRQHQLLARLVTAWADRVGEARTCFFVGDPMQSIYFFRDADPELFPRVEKRGLELPNGDALHVTCVQLSANFRTAPTLVENLNRAFTEIFAENDGSGVGFSAASPARPEAVVPAVARELAHFNLHLNFKPQSYARTAATSLEADGSAMSQTAEVLELIQSKLPEVEAARAGGYKYRIAVLARTRSALEPITMALRDARIPFRALDLEKLSARPEILDALALARATLNPLDRVAWLGLLRAPWCGLALDDLHTLTSADQPALQSRPVPELLRERLHLLSPAGSAAASRVLAAFANASGGSQVVPSTGTWLQQIWLRLGGADCCNATERANLTQLWACLDCLPGGQADLLGPQLHIALDQLTAQPDPDASGDAGIQLMTIHKSKGLEFEVVIVPELQAKAGSGGQKLLSWLERGVQPGSDFDNDSDDHDPVDDITEFLIAPLQPKGHDRGKSKAWVDRVYRQREAQESRRILYVAATRAREELHLFARPGYKADANGDLALVEPASSLLATAWPALEVEVRARFDQWKLTLKQDQAGSTAEVASIAATAENSLFLMPAAARSPRPTLLRRLPIDYQSPDRTDEPGTPKDATLVSGLNAPQLYTRHQGGLLSRAFGVALHAFIEHFTRLRMHLDWKDALVEMPKLEGRIVVQARAIGLDSDAARSIASDALRCALDAANDPVGKWILSPRAEAAIEARWSGVVGNEIRTVQVDRVFRAGLAPNADGEDAWWIIDYKSHASSRGLDAEDELRNLRPLFAPQLEAYGRVLRNLHGDQIPMRAGIYYPRMLRLDWWEL